MGNDRGRHATPIPEVGLHHQGARRQRHHSTGRKMEWTGLEARRYPLGLASFARVRCVFQWARKS